MKTRRCSKPIAALLVLLLLLLMVKPLLWLRGQWQENLNRQLADAMIRLDTKTALVLVDEGADPNTLYSLPATPTLQERMDYLLRRKPLPRIFTDCSGDSMFMLVCGTGWDSATNREASVGFRSDNLPLIQAMYEHGAIVNAKSGFGVTALHYAAAANRLHIVEWLLQHGADINVQDEGGRTPLIMATQNGHLQMMRLLLTHGANPNLQNSYGWTPLDYASQNYTGNSGRAALLVGYGAKRNQ